MRYISIFGLLSITVISILLIKYVGIFVLFLGLYSLSMIVLIKFPILNIYNDRIVIKKVSILKQLSDETVYFIKDITEIKFSYGYTSWIKVFLTTLITGILRTYMNEQNSKSDTITLITKNERIAITRIGKKKEFIRIYELLKDKINMLSN